MYDQIRQDTLYIMLYAVVTAMSMLACCYLLFRRGNAFAPDITTPARLRRWTAVFFAAFALNLCGTCQSFSSLQTRILDCVTL